MWMWILFFFPCGIHSVVLVCKYLMGKTKIRRHWQSPLMITRKSFQMSSKWNEYPSFLNFTYFLPILRWCRPSQFCLGAYWEPAHLQQISEENIMYLHISEVGVIFVGRKLLQTEFVGFIRWWNSCSLSHISGSKFWTSTLAVLCPFCASLLEPAPAIWAQESHWCKKEIM